MNFRKWEVSSGSTGTEIILHKEHGNPSYGMYLAQRCFFTTATEYVISENEFSCINCSEQRIMEIYLVVEVQVLVIFLLKRKQYAIEVSVMSEL